ncbi:MAG: hypothetical protein ACKO21_07410, partial [Nodosilinea sp.]
PIATNSPPASVLTRFTSVVTRGAIKPPKRLISCWLDCKPNHAWPTLWLNWAIPPCCPPTYTLATPEQLAHGLGASFAEQVAAVTQLGWQGPFTSVYGSHLLRVTDIQPGRPATLAEVWSEVRRDWQRDRQAQQGAAAYQRLRDRYRLMITPAAQAQLTPPQATVGERPA